MKVLKDLKVEIWSVDEPLARPTLVPTSLGVLFVSSEPTEPATSSEGLLTASSSDWWTCAVVTTWLELGKRGLFAGRGLLDP